MKTIFLDLIAALIMGMVLPGMLLNGAATLAAKHMQPVVTFSEEPAAEDTETVAARVRDAEGNVNLKDMNGYLVGVVLAEMPAYFEEEALKAQAVAARTYTCKAMITGGKHGDGSVCTDSRCCQAYITPDDYCSRGGSEEDIHKVTSAVRQTGMKVLTYEGELIEATYFSCSGGTTEAAQAVWGTEYPYLKSVPSPGEESAARYRETFSFTPEAFQAELGVTLEGEPIDWFGLTAYSEGGGVSVMTIGEERYSGTDLRSKLDLPSTAFELQVMDGEIRITTKGYGHRVGMSQYGADAMAVQGNSYEKILAHYYPGTELMELGIDENGEIQYRN